MCWPWARPRCGPWKWAVGEDGRVQAGEAQTNLFLWLGKQFRVIGGLLTNFHLPKSTLLVLVSAFAGKELIFRAV